ncbi:hypothetical protein A0J61_03213 [Choanephora cucurbitarum]|uniref:Uncharacterized protein n=1 Tax=Choanephora cucurbitarum TaxID=101091 RepID=A0A1C7NN98_9FUNG|nr:hypothetical protein A0J61_03213 [Choanephora cucurbitarum]
MIRGILITDKPYLSLKVAKGKSCSTVSFEFEQRAKIYASSYDLLLQMFFFAIILVLFTFPLHFIQHLTCYQLMI